ncbi:MAG: 2TM domain-containing protein [Saprospiraceae bacterium]|nr:2TM domain-containing protein [Saprospiraceae bacterium]
MKSKYEIAKARVKKKSEFHSHLVTYLVTCGFLLAINLITSSDYLWAIWPFLGWGIGVVFHGLDAYGVIGDKVREEEMIQKELEKMEHQERYGNDASDERLELPDLEKQPRWDEEDFV